MIKVGDGRFAADQLHNPSVKRETDFVNTVTSMLSVWVVTLSSGGYWFV